MKIDIILAECDVGTVAVVTQPRMWRAPVERRYICAKADPWGGGRWICTETGEHAEMTLEALMNRSTQGAVALRELGLYNVNKGEK